MEVLQRSGAKVMQNALSEGARRRYAGRFSNKNHVMSPWGNFGSR
jgi:hypothetical protein